MSSRMILAVAIGVWTLITWGGRVRLLTDAEQSSVSNWIRIGGSILIGLIAVGVLLWARETAVERWVLGAFALWSSAIWLRSLITVWTGDQSMAFKAVHTLLAGGYFVLSYFAIRIGWI